MWLTFEVHWNKPNRMNGAQVMLLRLVVSHSVWIHFAQSNGIPLTCGATCQKQFQELHLIIRIQFRRPPPFL